MILPNHLLRRDDEEYFHWKKRVLLGKLNKETTLEWDELTEVLGESCSGDHLRKTAYGIREFQEYLDEVTESSITDSNVLDELELKKIELLEERKKLQTIRVDYNKLIREKARKDLIIEHFKEGFEKIPTPDIEFLPTEYQRENAQAVLAFGDAHWGKVFESYWNSYSPEEFDVRMRKMAEETIAYCRKEGFNELEILSMADSIEGMSLRISQLQSLRVGFIDQAIEFSKYMAKWLSELSKHFTKIIYRHIPSANHSEVRPFNSSRNEFPAEDFEKVIINYLHDVLADNDRVEIPIYKDQIIDFQILDFDHAATHGHAVKKSKNVLKDISFHRQKFYQVLWIAHYHHSDLLTAGENANSNLDIIGIPSIMGSDSYSDSLLTGAKAGAIIVVFEEGKGRKDLHNIILN
jgi:hypothetical protein